MDRAIRINKQIRIDEWLKAKLQDKIDRSEPKTSRFVVSFFRWSKCKKINILMLKSTHEWGKTYTNISESVFDYDLESHLYCKDN